MMNDFRWVFLPYCLQRQDDGRYIVLNRFYKPLGEWDGGPGAQAGVPRPVKIKGLTAARAARISYNRDGALDAVYLYNDDCVPTLSDEYMKDYLGRLALLSKLDVEG